MDIPVIYLDFGGDDLQDAAHTRRQNRSVESAQQPRIARPRVGLLTQTVISSPTVQWILPARLRGQRFNDVVFVGERHIQIKEIVPGLHLEDAVVKSDFDANIMAADVVSVSAKVPWEEQMRLGGGNPHTTYNPGAHGASAPQIMVLTLSSRDMVFLYHAGEDDDRFVQFCRPLPSEINPSESFGRHICVDPR